MHPMRQGWHPIVNLGTSTTHDDRAWLNLLAVADAREAIGGDVQLTRRFEELAHPRWQGDEKFERLVVARRHLPLRPARQISARTLRWVLRRPTALPRAFSGCSMTSRLPRSVQVLNASTTPASRPGIRSANQRPPMHDTLADAPPLSRTPPPFPGELLSSWLRPIAAHYAVDLPHLACHIGLPVWNTP